MKTINRFFVFLIIMMFAATMFPFFNVSASEVISGTTGNCLWEYNTATKTLALSAINGTDGKTASFPDYRRNESFSEFADEITTVIIKEGVTELGSHLFLNFSALTSVEFPTKSLISLGEGVFRNCDALTEIELPSTIISISRALFWDCEKLENVVLRGKYETLPEIIFGQCKKLETVTIPASVSALELSISESGIPRGVFYNDANLRTVYYGGTTDNWGNLINSINYNSSDSALLKHSGIRVVCSDGVYAYGSAGEETDFSVPVDFVTAKKLFDISYKPESISAVNNNYFQGLEIYDDYVFAIYDGGYCRVYRLDTGKFIQEFRLECALESNHASGAFFGNYKYAQDDPFPLMYISGDLSTLSCYVERILVDENGIFSSEMVQLLDFSALKGWNKNPTSHNVTTHNGSFVLLEKETDTIVYLGRQQRDIGAANNKFVAAHFSLPVCKDGYAEGKVYPLGYTVVGESEDDKITVDCPVVHFSNNDIISPKNAKQDEDGYYYWDYFGRYYQGTYIYEGNVLTSHGLNKNYPNYWNDKVFYTGIMAYGYDSDKMLRTLDVSGSLDWYGEPQALVVYNDRIIHYIKGALYELFVVVDGLENSYNISCASNSDSVIKAITEAVENDIDRGFEVKSVILPEEFKPDGNKTFNAEVSIYTIWNTQTFNIDINMTLDFSKQSFSSGKFCDNAYKLMPFLNFKVFNYRCYLEDLLNKIC